MLLVLHISRIVGHVCHFNETWTINLSLFDPLYIKFRCNKFTHAECTIPPSLIHQPHNMVWPTLRLYQCSGSFFQEALVESQSYCMEMPKIQYEISYRIHTLSYTCGIFIVHITLHTASICSYYSPPCNCTASICSCYSAPCNCIQLVFVYSWYSAPCTVPVLV